MKMPRTSRITSPSNSRRRRVSLFLESLEWRNLLAFSVVSTSCDIWAEISDGQKDLDFHEITTPGTVVASGQNAAGAASATASLNLQVTENTVSAQASSLSRSPGPNAGPTGFILADTLLSSDWRFSASQDSFCTAQSTLNDSHPSLGHAFSIQNLDTLAVLPISDSSSTISVPAGTYIINFGDGAPTYSGQSYDTSSIEASITLTIVSVAPTHTSISASPNPSYAGQPVSLTATVTSANSGSPVLGGKVEFMDGSAEIGNASLNASGQATYSTSGLSIGSHSITAVYSGDSDFAGSSSLPVSQVVAPLPDLAAEYISWHTNTGGHGTANGGGVDIVYDITGSGLPSPALVNLYWSHGATFDISKSTVAYATQSKTDVGSYLVRVQADQLNAPPSGTGGANDDLKLIVIVNDGKKVSESDFTNDTASLGASPKDVLSPVLDISSKKTSQSMNVVISGADIDQYVTPAGGALSISMAAIICGISHFNWVQQITSVPSNWIVFNGDTGKIESLPLDDPTTHKRVLVTPQLSNVVKALGDGSGFYYSEGLNGKAVEWSSPSVIPDPFTLEFYDSPRLGAGSYGPGEYMAFQTTLTGVSDSHNRILLPAVFGVSFVWKDNATFSGDGSAYEKVPAGSRLAPASFGGTFGLQHAQVSFAGPSSFGSQGFVSTSRSLAYSVYFENPSDSSVSNQRVTITEQLDSHLDWNTFQLTQVEFGSYGIPIPPHTLSYSAAVPVGIEGKTFEVDVTADLDVASGLFTLVLASVDPGTGLPPSGGIGFLPPEDGTGRGMGHVSFTIQPKKDSPSGTELENAALIAFDSNSPVQTNTVENTLDSVPPTSNVFALPAFSQPSFAVEWSGQDDVGGSGIAAYSIYVADNGHGFTPWLANTTQTSGTYVGVSGHNYAFYSVAVDNAGNVQPAPEAGQATTQTLLDRPSKQYVDAVYGDVLGRAPDLEGLNYWSSQLDAGVPRSTLVNLIDHSAEYFGTIIEPAYFQFLGRRADPAGLNYWTGQMINGLTDEHLEAGFIGSSEFFDLAGATDRGWVDALYQSLLSRPADSSGETYWTGKLSGGVSRATVAYGFAAGSEREGQHVMADYQKYLGRSAGTSEIAYWVGQFSIGATNEAIVTGFVSSDEYYQKHTRP